MSDAFNLDENRFKFSITPENDDSEENVNQKPKSLSLNSKQVSTWLDNHPEFLNEYLKKLQYQRRSSIMSDKSSTLLANLHSNLRMQTQLIDFNQINNTELNRISSLSLFNKDFDLGLTNKNKLTNPVFNKTISVNYASKETPAFNFNLSASEPNLPPATDKHYQFVPDSNRKGFKNLSLYEKMYTLVKTLYHSLDLKTTCKKILNTVSLLLDADRCSLFLVIEDDKAECKKSLVSVVFDAQSNESIQTANQKDESVKLDCEILTNGNGDDDANIRIPYGKGIAGYVASTGQALNIKDAYKDPRFNSTIDQITGYRTKSVLCLPILNEHGQCIAVAEAINKSAENSDESWDDSVVAFSDQDEEVLKNTLFTNLYRDFTSVTNSDEYGRF